MTRPHSHEVAQGLHRGQVLWGLGSSGPGFWLGTSNSSVMLEGYDAGVSFRSRQHQTSAIIYTVTSNTSAGAWPVTERFDELTLS